MRLSFRGAARVVRDMMGDHRLNIWLSDGYSAQQGHGHHHQTCLAHLARDIAFAPEASDEMVQPRLKLWLDKLFALARNVTGFAVSTLKANKRQLENTLADILASATNCEIAATLQTKLAKWGKLSQPASADLC